MASQNEGFKISKSINIGEIAVIFAMVIGIGTYITDTNSRLSVLEYKQTEYTNKLDDLSERFSAIRDWMIKANDNNNTQMQHLVERVDEIHNSINE